MAAAAGRKVSVPTASTGVLPPVLCKLWGRTLIACLGPAATAAAFAALFLLSVSVGGLALCGVQCSTSLIIMRVCVGVGVLMLAMRLNW